MAFPIQRLRRLRSNEAIRRMIRETQLAVDDLIYPLFVTHGEGVARPVEAMPGIYNYSIDRLLEEVSEVARLKIPGILLFGIPAGKDEFGSEAYAAEGIIQQAVRAIKKGFPDLLVVTDICLCEYTSHGHCGVVRDGRVMNDETVELLAEIALSHAAAGVDIVAPSDMMDGRVKAIRTTLDTRGYEEVLVMSYSAKYASAFYGPFREAAGSSPHFGDRQAYQMDPANAHEALREVQLDIEEGADIIMVKPALAYLDVIRRVKDQFLFPLAAYNVSGEYTMVKAAAQKGWIDEKKVVLELLTGMKRAGTDIILTYHAKDVAEWLLQEGV
ncbi:MAG: porphobilinogen synthase [Desulfotomaculaceae bacterium]|nr:porphobilinogen synthase [Desulfotomaculaceae bacterium]